MKSVAVSNPCGIFSKSVQPFLAEMLFSIWTNFNTSIHPFSATCRTRSHRQQSEQRSPDIASREYRGDPTQDVISALNPLYRLKKLLGFIKMYFFINFPCSSFLRGEIAEVWWWVTECCNIVVVTTRSSHYSFISLSSTHSSDESERLLKWAWTIFVCQ